jgi:hypothetical protein
MRSSALVGLSILILSAVLGCAPSTQLTDVWSNPEVQGPLQFKKVLAVVLVSDPAVRRTAEGKLTVLMKQTEGVPSWMAVSDETARDRTKTEAMLKREGFDGAVVMRLVSANQTTTWVSTSYPDFWGYWGYAYPMAMNSGYLKTDTTIRVETRVYSLKDDRLVWAGFSRTMNPESGDQILSEVAQAVGQDMRERGLIR